MASGNPTADAADFGIKAIMGISQGVIAEAQANAANMVNEANAYASNLVRKANNELRASRANLARYTQSVNNQRTLDNAGSNAEAALINYRRARDSAVNDDFEQQIAFAEQAGAQAAAAALTGLSGGVADIVAGTSALRKARLQGRVQEAMRQGDWDAQRQQVNIMQAGWDSLDQSEITADLDYSVDIATKQTRGGNLLLDIMGGQDMKGVANIVAGASSFFKSSSYDAFADRAGPVGSGYGGNGRTITGGR